MNRAHSSGPSTRGLRLAIVQPEIGQPSETFLDNQARGLPADTTIVYGLPPMVDGRPVLGDGMLERARRAVRRVWGTSTIDWSTQAYLELLRTRQIDVVLAQYGVTGVGVMQACALAKVPLVVHFHGYDATRRDILDRYGEQYRAMFGQAGAVVAVSRAMERQLAALGADPGKVHYNPCGISCDLFAGARPAEAPPHLLAVGRFVDKKCPHLTLLAFSKVVQAEPDARLDMIGDGPLLAACQDLARAWRIGHAVNFLGARPTEDVQMRMRQVRAFVQHSVQAASGDCEGTPVAILEAGASGLPVVATRHGGIQDVVVEGVTGLLVDERDVNGMAEAMSLLVKEPARAASLGTAARAHVSREFNLDRSIARLWAIIADAYTQHRTAAGREPRGER